MTKSSQIAVPTFLGIGSQKCASTWLYMVLKAHPEIHVSKRKELQFFSTEFVHKDMEWYLNHFKSEKNTPIKHIRGEISPQYCRLSSHRVQSIAKLFPNLKIVLIIRHPLQRAWSQAIYDLGKNYNRNLESVSENEFLLYVERWRSKAFSDYVRTIKIWRQAFGADAVLVVLKDEIDTDKEKVIRKILTHIGANPDIDIRELQLERNVNRTKDRVKRTREMPEIVRWYLAKQLLSPTVELQSVIDQSVDHWIQDLELYAKQGKASWHINRFIIQNIAALPERFLYALFDQGRDILFRYKELVGEFRLDFEPQESDKFQNLISDD